MAQSAWCNGCPRKSGHLAASDAGAIKSYTFTKISGLLVQDSRFEPDPAVVAKLRGTDDAQGLYAILTEPAANPKSASAA